MGDWFPLGMLASQRYALLKRTPLLPHEELLCNEAIMIYEKRLLNDEGEKMRFSSGCVMASFERLIQHVRRDRKLLMNSGARISLIPTNQGTILCGFCKRDCYVAYFSCGCKPDPTCLHHGTLLPSLIFFHHCHLRHCGTSSSLSGYFFSSIMMKIIIVICLLPFCFFIRVLLQRHYDEAHHHHLVTSSLFSSGYFFSFVMMKIIIIII